MKLFNIIEHIRGIQEPHLFEAVYQGFLTIYENGSDINIAEMETETYDEAFQDMKDHFAPITDKSQFQNEMDPFAFNIFKTYQSHQKNIEAELDRLDENELTLVVNTVNELMHVLSGQNSFEDYMKVLKDKVPTFVRIFGSGEKFVEIMNELIESEKFNALYHRVKDHFMPHFIKMK